MRELIVDNFAGGGGASTGISMALGRSPDIAINHNPAALALHEANHPETLHLSENIYKVDPLDHVKGRRIGLAWFSPDCKHFSKAKGGAPVERNIRDLAHVIPHRVERCRKGGGDIDVIIMENVEEFRDWGPLVETPRGLMPDVSRKGQTFGAWCKRLRKLGGKLEWRELRACDYGAPTIRKRLFVIIRFDGKRIVWPEPTHGAPDDPDVLAGRKQPWKTAASDVIDWSIPCPSIFDDAETIRAAYGVRAIRPLAANTMARIARGMKRYVIDTDRPFLVNLTHGGRCEDAGEPVNTITGAHRGEKAVISPSVIRFNTGATGQDTREPLSTVTANSFRKRPGGAAPLGVAAAHLAAYYGEGDGGNDRTADPQEPLGTVTTENRHAVVSPYLSHFYTSNTSGGQGDARRPIKTVTAEGGHAAIVAPHLMTMRNAQKPFNGADEPCHTITAGGAGLSVVAPVLSYAQQGGGNRDAGDPVHTITASDKDQNQVLAATLVGCGGRAGQSRPRGMDEPAATITAKADSCVAAAFIAQHNNDSRRIGGVNPGREADEPLSTVTASGAQQGIVSAFISRQFGNSTGHGCDEPSATVTAAVNKSALVAPFMQKYYGTGDGSRPDEPCHTVTVKDRHGHVEGVIADPPFTPAMEGRARDVAGFLRAHGFWDEREFVTLAVDDAVFVIVDIGMRMLTPRELYNAQGFPSDYEIERGADGTRFTKSVQVSCVGNSVSPPLAAALVGANCGHLAEFREAAE